MIEIDLQEVLIAAGGILFIYLLYLGLNKILKK